MSTTSTLPLRPHTPAEPPPLPAGHPTLRLVPQTPDPVDDLWADYLLTGSDEARECLILHYAPLVTSIAAKLARGLSGTVELADLVSYGIFGLLDALGRYAPERGAKFETFATARIRGAIVDELRRMDWVPRSVRTKARALDKAHSELAHRLHRAPSHKELATEAGMTTGELHRTMAQVAATNVIALHEPTGHGTGAPMLADTLAADTNSDPAHAADAAATTRLLADLINELDERDKLVISLYYYEQMTLKEIAAVIGVSESRVSQVHSATISRLRRGMLAAIN